MALYLDVHVIQSCVKHKVWSGRMQAVSCKAMQVAAETVYSLEVLQTQTDSSNPSSKFTKASTKSL
jgi:hypothetical protein